MKCYVINLDRATDRLAFQKEQFARSGLKFERVPACLRDPMRVVLLGKHHRTKRGEALAAAGAKLEIVDEDWDFCTEGYVLGKEAAKNLSEHQQRVRTYPDAWGYFRKKGWIRLSRVMPPITGQAVDEYASSLGNRYIVTGHGLLERCWWKARRVVGVILDALMDGGRLGW